MKLKFTKEAIGGSPELFIRRCGYGKYFDKRMNKVSYMKRANISMMFPRYHVYIEDRGEEVVFDLHLDQKRGIYEGGPAHGGEYEGSTVEREVGRIESFIERA